jgi:hypothetical protein
VIEEMVKRWRQRLFDGLRIDTGAIANRRGQSLIIEIVYVAIDKNVLRPPRCP